VRGHGFQRQDDTIREFAAENGYAVKEVFRDAFTGTEADRPEFNSDVCQHPRQWRSHDLSESLDRLARM